MKRILCNLFFFIIGFGIGIILMIYRCGYILENKQKRADKYYAYYMFLERWISHKEQEDQVLNNYFLENNIKSVAIYGMGKIGQHLKYELDKSGIKTEYVIDEGERVIYRKENHYNLHDKLPMVDVIIVTPIKEFAEIRDRILSNNEMIKVISIEEII